MINTNQLSPFTIIKVKKHEIIQSSDFNVVRIKKVEIVTPGNQVGVKLRNPVEMSFLGQTPNMDETQTPNLVETQLTALR